MRPTTTTGDLPAMTLLVQLLDKSAAGHAHLCPRQVLGVRMGLLAGRLLGLEVPNVDRRLLALIETDGCAADGVSAATGCTVGNRRLRVLDYGKVAATFVDRGNDKAIRIVPRKDVRALAQRQVPDARSRWHAQLKAYQITPDSDLLVAQEVTLTISLEQLLSKPGFMVRCETCGEEILTERKVFMEGATLCRACAGQSYYLMPWQASVQTLGNRELEVKSLPEDRFSH